MEDCKHTIESLSVNFFLIFQENSLGKGMKNPRNFIFIITFCKVYFVVYTTNDSHSGNQVDIQK